MTNLHIQDPLIGKAAFIDVETTGLNPAVEEIIEMAIVLFSYHRQTGKILETIDQYVGLREPSCPISPGAYRVHRISKKAVQGKILDHSRIETMINQAEFIIAHNAQFDLSFVKRLFPEAASKPWLCSMTGINWYRKGYRSRGLQNLLTAHDIQVETAHRADADVRACLLLLSHQNPEGKSYLLELIERLQPAAKEQSG
ncbi:MAG TPA: exonuclease domain-containing protein [Bacillota bacterium]|nr:exonuclease domain-containing protein [Bacillota bacterium]HPT87168.1 exonuclease domain-containing protein [Bacillota bacterium]